MWRWWFGFDQDTGQRRLSPCMTGATKQHDDACNHGTTTFPARVCNLEVAHVAFSTPAPHATTNVAKFARVECEAIGDEEVAELTTPISCSSLGKSTNKSKQIPCTRPSCMLIVWYRVPTIITTATMPGPCLHSRDAFPAVQVPTMVSYLHVLQLMATPKLDTLTLMRISTSYLGADRNEAMSALELECRHLALPYISVPLGCIDTEVYAIVPVAALIELKPWPDPQPSQCSSSVVTSSPHFDVWVCRSIPEYHRNQAEIPLNGSHPVFVDDGRLAVLQRVGSVAANFVLLHIILSSFNYLGSANAEDATNQLAAISLLVLLLLIHCQRCCSMNESITTNSIHGTNVKDAAAFHGNPYCNSKALENTKDIQFDHADVKGNTHNGPVVRLSFASLFDALGNILDIRILKFTVIYRGLDCVQLDENYMKLPMDNIARPLLVLCFSLSGQPDYDIHVPSSSGMFTMRLSFNGGDGVGW
ncbi:dymeclin [Hordeum vulgare]|nr:dymeclin [Hordeum vulgare]